MNRLAIVFFGVLNSRIAVFHSGVRDIYLGVAMKITVGPKNLGELFLGNRVVEIPTFQRSFVWKAENVRQLLEDLFNSAGNNDPHFFGPIVLFDRSPDDSPKSHYEIVDGQQRVTTAVMILSILRDFLDDVRYFQDRSFGGHDFEFAFKSMLFLPGLGKNQKFRASHLIRNFYEGAVVAENPQKRFGINSRGTGLSQEMVAATKDLRRDYLYIHKYLRSKMEPLQEHQLHELYASLLKSLTTNFQLHSMVVHDEVDAYRLFESVNYLGLKLEPGDLVKSLTLRKIQTYNPNNLKAALDTWDEFLSNLAGYPVSKFLRHYLAANQTATVPGSKVFSIFKGKLESSASAAGQTLVSLAAASAKYAVTLGAVPADPPSTTIDGVAKRLNIIGDTHRILLLSILESSLKPSQLDQAFRAAEYLVFRVVCARDNAQDVENMYQSLGQSIKLVKNQGELDAWCQGLFAGCLTDLQLQTFAVKNCSRLGINYDPREDLGRYALACLETDMGGGWAAQNSLEHLAPQNPASSANWKNQVGDQIDSYETQIRWWGNLTILERPLNSAIGNSDWAKKLTGDPAKNIDGLSKSGYLLTKQVCQTPKFGSTEIVARGEWILGALLSIRNQQWVLTGQNNAKTIRLWP